MKWFKHISDSIDDPFIADLITEFGGDGYMVFFGILEMMSREFDVENPGKVSLSYTFIQNKLHLRSTKLIRILEFCKRNERILYESNGKYLTLNCPKLKDLCDEYTKKELSKKSGVCPDNVPIGVGSLSRIEVEVEVDKDIKEKKYIKKRKVLDLESPKFEEWWKAYPKRNGVKTGKSECKAFFLREIKETDYLDLLTATNNYSNSKEVKSGYAKDPIRFLKKEIWRDFIFLDISEPSISKEVNHGMTWLSEAIQKGWK